MNIHSEYLNGSYVFGINDKIITDVGIGASYEKAR